MPFAKKSVRQQPLPGGRPGDDALGQRQRARPPERPAADQALGRGLRRLECGRPGGGRLGSGRRRPRRCGRASICRTTCFSIAICRTSAASSTLTATTPRPSRRLAGRSRLCLTAIADEFGAEIPCCPYTDNEGDHIGQAILRHRNRSPAILLANHGVFAWGHSPRAAALKAAVMTKGRGQNGFPRPAPRPAGRHCAGGSREMVPAVPYALRAELMRTRQKTKKTVTERRNAFPTSSPDPRLHPGQSRLFQFGVGRQDARPDHSGDGDAGGAGGRARRGPDQGRLRPIATTRPSSAELFRQNKVQGIVVGAVNFGEEQSVAWTVRQAGLDVPVLIFGCQEEETLTLQTPRRDAFCGLLSIGDVLRQIGADTPWRGGRSAFPPIRRSRPTSIGSAASAAW